MLSQKSIKSYPTCEGWVGTDCTITFATRITGHQNQNIVGARLNPKMRRWFLMQQGTGLCSLPKDGVVAERVRGLKRHVNR